MARKHKSYRPRGVRNRDLPRLHGLVGVRRAQQHQIRKRAKVCHLFHRLTRRSVLAQSDAVVVRYIDDVSLAEGRQSDAGPHVVGNVKKVAAKGRTPPCRAMPGQSRHRVPANTEMNIPPGISGRTAFQALVGGAPSEAEQGTLEVAVSLERGARGRIEVARAVNQVRYASASAVDSFVRRPGRYRAVRRREAGKSRSHPFGGSPVSTCRFSRLPLDRRRPTRPLCRFH